MLNFHTTIKAFCKLSSNSNEYHPKKKRKKSEKQFEGEGEFKNKNKKPYKLSPAFYSPQKNAFHAPQLLVIVLISPNNLSHSTEPQVKRGAGGTHNKYLLNISIKKGM